MYYKGLIGTITSEKVSCIDFEGFLHFIWKQSLIDLNELKYLYNKELLGCISSNHHLCSRIMTCKVSLNSTNCMEDIWIFQQNDTNIIILFYTKRSDDGGENPTVSIGKVSTLTWKVILKSLFFDPEEIIFNEPKITNFWTFQNDVDSGDHRVTNNA